MLEGWEVVVIVNATGKWSFYPIVQTILIGFLTDFLYVKIFSAGPWHFFIYLSYKSKTAK